MAEHQSKLYYRQDIDGLRAIAVLLVVFDHLHTRVRGGYIGVDVFFVISGYLISSTILKEIDAGTFSIAAFYERRIRRIFPAFLAMLFVVTLLEFRFCVPSELEAYGRSMVSAIFSLSNFLFWHEAGYFDAPSSLKPLLHTWSLAVEEQFYLFFPLFLLAIKRWLPGRLKPVIWSVTAISFVLACAWVRRDPTAAFFFAPLRAWELLCGTVLSQKYIPAIRGYGMRNLTAICGLLLILVPAFVYTAHTLFPGVTALLPCVGALLLIAAGEYGPTLVGSILMLRPIAAVGLISYSLYLWHWPIQVFQNNSYILLKEPPGSKPAKIAVFVTSMIVATLSWRFIERPFRWGAWRPDRQRLLIICGCASALLVGFGTALLVLRGLPDRFPPEALAIDRFTTFKATEAYRENVCFIGPDSTYADFNKDLCLNLNGSGSDARPQLLLLGDSHAAALYPGLNQVFPELNISQANTASCRPFLQQTRQPGDCGSMYRFIYGDYLIHHHPSAVLLSGRWDETEFQPLAETIQWLHQHGQHVVLFGPSIEFDVPLPRLLSLSIRDRAPGDIEKHRAKEPIVTDRLMSALARSTWHVPYISMYDDLCKVNAQTSAENQPENVPDCPTYAGSEVPLLFDTDHLTPQGSVLMARAIRNRHQLQ